jgi:hypothetical protein
MRKATGDILSVIFARRRCAQHIHFGFQNAARSVGFGLRIAAAAATDVAVSKCVALEEYEVRVSIRANFGHSASHFAD